MKTKSSTKTPKTISQMCSKPEGTFQRFLEQKRTVLGRMNKEVDQKMKASSERMAWAAAA